MLNEYYVQTEYFNNYLYLTLVDVNFKHEKDKKKLIKQGIGFWINEVFEEVFIHNRLEIEDVYITISNEKFDGYQAEFIKSKRFEDFYDCIKIFNENKKDLSFPLYDAVFEIFNYNPDYFYIKLYKGTSKN